tara:strand:+ start:5832 stop:7598 length:1767 start_codon:yes stop_codon:yes gene_type:complete
MIKTPIFNRYNLFNFKIGVGSPKFIFILFILHILVIEVAIMLAFEFLDFDNHLINALIDSVALISLIIPFFYLFIYKPTLNYIVDFKRISEKIVESEEKFKNAFEYSAIGMALISPKGKWLKINTKLCQIVGYSEEELLSMTYKDITHPNDRANDLNFTTQLLAGAIESYTLEKRYVHKQGNTVWVLLAVSLVRDKVGTPLYFVSKINDITDRKITEEKLIISQNRLRDAQRIGKLGTIDWDLITNDVELSEETARIYCFEEGVTILPVEEIVKRAHPEDLERTHKSLMDALEGKAEHNIEHRIICTDGKIVYLHAIAKIFRDSTNKPIRMLGTNLDITERKLAEQEIQQKNKELEKLNIEKDKFFSIIAHDLRGPFSGFLGLTELLAEKHSSLNPEKLQKMVVSMKNSAENINALLENLLQWARAEQGLIPFTPKTIELYPLINESVSQLKETALKKGVEIYINISNDLIAFGDINMIQTIIRNLISNALKFTNKGGEISIAAKMNEENSVLLSVKDTGIGMNQTLLDNLFRIDMQTNRKGTENEPSSGLGLLLCKDFVEKNAGKIWVESEENIGSIFYFTIPQKTA